MLLDIHISEKTIGVNKIIDNLNLVINSNGIYGIVGKNGTGKTTLFKCILGIESYSGLNNSFEKMNLRNTCWCPTETYLYEDLTVNEFYRFYDKLMNINLEDERILVFKDIPLDIQIKNLSTGMRKKMFLNALFQKSYKYYILDEPFNGLDLEANFILWNYIKKISGDSLILVSSHILDSLVKNCEAIFVLKNGGGKYFSSNQFNQIEDFLFKSIKI
ncbi:ABC transporter ATP-binding protein [Flavobacterium columnare NBRC 100251 = ATCC 23463]|uniref:ATP-binding cassette domain-containing protein n=2 Tax=Flavobacterium TaxID=237 RepID=A0A2T4HDW9_9FLAO|nr:MULTISPECIES: ATP-binding cassette domain-containing protein [Flavobacterium]ANO49697.1 ABC transporter ATPase [Flavobacterium columnare]APT22370.1 ABC transporter ATP-binding protein [Flavobacterium columnare]MBF6653093.1 ABC transporter ATP-binding protein [Flavobacterium columnare]MBF6656157.1 ABC transporter ATP-binding protein [Flavobacterium columnare]MBF6659043.1 ABC transporter ATP-binding protein [Flavobacterium columnare]